jgi:proteic killer suppression protein
MTDVEELHDVPTWRVHRLAGERKDTWSVHVTRNWRITFRVDEIEATILDLDYEDYH